MNTRSISPICLALVLVGTSSAQAQTTQFTKGEIRLKVGGEALVIPLGKIAGASSLMPAGPGRWMLGLFFKGPRDANEFARGVRFALHPLTGPGKYGNTVIGNLVVEVKEDEPWNFDEAHHQCTVVVARLGASGVEGSIACTGTAGGTVPFSEMTFTAAP